MIDRARNRCCACSRVVPAVVWANGGCPHCSAPLPEAEQPAESSSAGDPETMVSDSIAAFNARDYDRLLASLDAKVALYPLRLDGIDAAYNGHPGVLEWLGQLERTGYTPRVALSETRMVHGDSVLAVGGVTLGGGIAETPFCGLHEFAGSQIASIHHYFSRPETLSRIGIIG